VVIPGKAIVGAVVVVLSAAAVLAPSAAATTPCPVDYCTTPSGEYVLEVPPLTNPFLAAYADCVWNAHVDFGDATDEDYVYDAAVGVTGSHVFPTPGVTYTVTVALADGHHGQTTDPCPDYALSTEVRYRTPAEEAGDPPAPAPGTPVGEGGIQPAPLLVAPDASIPNAVPVPQSTPTPARPAPYWRRCRGGLLTHLVSCRKARRVARAASARLTRAGTVQAGGFSCRVSPGQARWIACRRGEQRILVTDDRRLGGGPVPR